MWRTLQAFSTSTCFTGSESISSANADRVNIGSFQELQAEAKEAQRNFKKSSLRPLRPGVRFPPLLRVNDFQFGLFHIERALAGCGKTDFHFAEHTEAA